MEFERISSHSYGRAARGQMSSGFQRLAGSKTGIAGHLPVSQRELTNRSDRRTRGAVAAANQSEYDWHQYAA